MTRKEFVSSIWVRLFVAFWIFILPIFIFMIPGIAYLEGEPINYTRLLYGAAMWILGPLVARSVLSMVFGPKQK
ncbi:MAG: hypothetical protein AB8B49_11160 [Nitratireductor sp.]